MRIKPKLPAIKSASLSTFFALFAFYLLRRFVGEIREGQPKQSWGITEWLINYQGGFVKRGLPGEIILNLYSHFGISPYYVILCLCVILYLALAVFFIGSFLKKGYPLFILPLVLLLGGPIMYWSWLRTDVLLILLFAGIIHLCAETTNIRIIAINALFVAGLLTHEAMAFFSFPILLLIFTRINRGTTTVAKSVAVALAQLSPSILAFLLCVRYHGSTAVAGMIWDSWKPIAFPIQDDAVQAAPAAIQALSLTTGEALYGNITSHTITHCICASAGWLAVFTFAYYLLTNTDRLSAAMLGPRATGKIDRGNVSAILVFQFLSLIPLFVFAWDYGRWVFFWATSSLSMLILIPEDRLATLFPEWLRVITAKLNHILDRILGRYKHSTLFIALTLGVPKENWSLHAYLKTNPVFLALGQVSHLLVYCGLPSLGRVLLRLIHSLF